MNFVSLFISFCHISLCLFGHSRDFLKRDEWMDVLKMYHSEAKDDHKLGKAKAEQEYEKEIEKIRKMVWNCLPIHNRSHSSFSMCVVMWSSSRWSKMNWMWYIIIGKMSFVRPYFPIEKRYHCIFCIRLYFCCQRIKCETKSR